MQAPEECLPCQARFVLLVGTVLLFCKAPRRRARQCSARVATSASRGCRHPASPRPGRGPHGPPWWHVQPSACVPSSCGSVQVGGTCEGSPPPRLASNRGLGSVGCPSRKDVGPRLPPILVWTSGLNWHWASPPSSQGLRYLKHLPQQARRQARQTRASPALCIRSWACTMTGIAHRCAPREGRLSSSRLH